MSNFKVGDKVKVISNSYCGTFKGVEGIVGKISEDNQEWPFSIDFPILGWMAHDWPFAEDELELVS
jgi:hypothetical protein